MGRKVHCFAGLFKRSSKKSCTVAIIDIVNDDQGHEDILKPTDESIANDQVNCDQVNIEHVFADEEDTFMGQEEIPSPITFDTIDKEEEKVKEDTKVEFLWSDGLLSGMFIAGVI